MLRWSLGYLAMAIVVAIGFSSLQGSDRPEREVVTRGQARRQSERSERTEDEERRGAWKTT